MAAGFPWLPVAQIVRKPLNSSLNGLLRESVVIMLPKFSIRQMMIGTAVLALFSAVLGWAARGSVLAYGMGIACLLLVIPFSVFAILYWISYLVARTFTSRSIAGPKTQPARSVWPGNDGESP